MPDNSVYSPRVYCLPKELGMDIADRLIPILEKDGISTLFLFIILYMIYRGGKWITPQIFSLAVAFLDVQVKKNAMLEESIEVTHALQKDAISAVNELKIVVQALTDMIRGKA